MIRVNLTPATGSAPAGRDPATRVPRTASAGTLASCAPLVDLPASRRREGGELDPEGGEDFAGRFVPGYESQQEMAGRGKVGTSLAAGPLEQSFDPRDQYEGLTRQGALTPHRPGLAARDPVPAWPAAPWPTDSPDGPGDGLGTEGLLGAAANLGEVDAERREERFLVPAH